MTGKLNDVLDAALPAAFVATVAGTCFSAADYIALLSIEHFAERLGWLPPGWEKANAATIYGAVALMTVLVMGFVGWWIYRAARNARSEWGRGR